MYGRVEQLAHMQHTLGSLSRTWSNHQTPVAVYRQDAFLKVNQLLWLSPLSESLNQACVVLGWTHAEICNSDLHDPALSGLLLDHTELSLINDNPA